MGRGRSSGPGPPRSSLTGRETIFYVGLTFLVCLLIAQAVHLWDASNAPTSITTVLSTTQVVRDQTSTRSGSKEHKVTTTTNVIIDGFLRDDKYRSQLDTVVGDTSGLGKASRGSNRLQIQPGNTEGRAVQPGDVLRGLAAHLSAGSTIRDTGEGAVSGDPLLLSSQLPKVVPRRFGQRDTAKGSAQVAGSAAGRSQDPAIDGVPASFDWQTYLLYHPEVRDAGVDNEKAAKRHYMEIGRQQGFIYKRLRVVLRYTACGGLINQQYSHIAAFSLAAVLGAELVLAPAVKRDSFAHYFSTFKEQNEVSWAPVPLESLLDVEALLSFWSNRSMAVHRVPALLPFPDLTQPETAFPLYNQPTVDAAKVVRLEHVYLQNLDMPELIEKARKAVIGHAAKLLQANHEHDLDYLVLDLPCTFFMLRSLSALSVVTEVAQSLKWAPAIQELADRVILGMEKSGAMWFNAVHLRVEKDARDWSTIMGGQQVIWHSYIQAMRQAGFTSNAPVYVASGLLTYGAENEMAHIVRTLRDNQLAKEVHYKEMYLGRAEIEALNSEQKALVDFLVLCRGRAFVGFGSSTFSFYLREYRALASLPRSSSVLVDASVIGTDPLFNAAGTVV